MDKITIHSDKAPKAIGPYVPGVKAGPFAFLSGQLGINPATGKLEDGIEAQTRRSLKNVEALLEAAGATLKDVVKTTVFISDMSNFAAVNDVYAEFFSDPFPARSCFEVGALPLGGLVEVEVVACVA